MPKNLIALLPKEYDGPAEHRPVGKITSGMPQLRTWPKRAKVLFHGRSQNKLLGKEANLKGIVIEIMHGWLAL